MLCLSSNTMNKKRKIIFCAFLIATLILTVIALNNVKALGIKSICLRENERLYYSDCNPNMDDYICHSTMCQLCVNEIREGVYCPANLNECQGACEYIYDAEEDNSDPVIETPEEDPETVVLISPENDYSIGQESQITFSFKVTKYQFQICELILNGEIKASKSRPIQYNRQYDLTTLVEEGEYNWRIDCTRLESDGGNIILSETRTLTVGNPSSTEGDENPEEPAPPASDSITVYSPDDNYAGTGAQDISFIFNIDESILDELTQCNLNLNSDTIGIAELNTSNTITQSVPVGSYTWNIECINQTGSLFSETRTLVINAVSNPDTSSGGGGGGGGGTSYRTYVSTAEQSTKGYTKEIKENEKIKFYLENNGEEEQHTITAGKVTETSVKLTIQSEPVETSLTISETKKLDLTSDGYYDLSIKLNSISNSKANLTIQTIKEKIPEEELKKLEEQKEASSDEENQKTIEQNIESSGITGAVVSAFNNNRTGFIIGFVIIIVFIAIMISYRNKGKKKK